MAVCAPSGLPIQPFLASPIQAMWIIIALSVWKNIGYFMVIFLAALQGVSQELYEAAALDGANRLRQMWHVAIPSVRPVIYFVVTISMITSVQLFVQPFIMTNGGPLDSTLSVVQLLYRHVVQQPRVWLRLGDGHGPAGDPGRAVAGQPPGQRLAHPLGAEETSRCKLPLRPRTGRTPVPRCRSPGPAARLRLCLILFAFLAAFPFYWIVIGSLMKPVELFARVPRLWPAEPSVGAYTRIFELVPLGRYFFNSIFVALVTVVVAVLICERRPATASRCCTSPAKASCSP